MLKRHLSTADLRGARVKATSVERDDFQLGMLDIKSRRKRGESEKTESDRGKTLTKQPVLNEICAGV